MRWSLPFLLLLAACGKDEVQVVEADTDTDTDADTDTDTDTDADTDTDTDTDTDADLDTDDDVVGLTGRSYLLDIASGTFIQPPGVGPLLQAQIDEDLLLGVVSTTGTDIQMIAALGDGSTPPVQDLCSPSIDFPSADFSLNPQFEVGPDDTTIDIQGNPVTIDSLFVSGSFSPDGATLQDTTLTGTIDTRPLVPLLDPNGAPNSVCTLVLLFGITCQPCPAGGDFCLAVEVEDMVATEVPGLALVERVQADIDVDPACTP